MSNDSKTPNSPKGLHRGRIIRRRKNAPEEPETPVEASPEKTEKKVQNPPSEAVKPEREASVPSLDAKALQAELDNLSKEDLDGLLTIGAPKRFHSGDAVTGQVVRVTKESVFLDIGGKSEGILDRSALEDDVPDVGAMLNVYVLRSDDFGIRLTQKLSGASARESLMQAHEAGIPIQGTVAGRNPGGFTVNLGGTTAFCPVSQIDRRRGKATEEELESYIGKKMSFRVTKITPSDLVVSHRVIAEEEAEARAALVWQTLEEGQVHKGVVSTVRDFGAIVDLDGAEGLVPRRLLGENNSSDPTPGDEIQVKVVAIDRAAKRITLDLTQPKVRASSGPKSSNKKGGRKQRDSGSLGTLGDLFSGIKLPE